MLPGAAYPNHLSLEIMDSIVLCMAFGKRRYGENTRMWKRNENYPLLLQKNSTASLCNKSVKNMVQLFRVFMGVWLQIPAHGAMVAKHLLNLQVEAPKSLWGEKHLYFDIFKNTSILHWQHYWEQY